MFYIKLVIYMLLTIFTLLGLIIVCALVGDILIGELGLVIGIFVGGIFGVMPFAYFYNKLMALASTR